MNINKSYKVIALLLLLVLTISSCKIGRAHV